MTILQRENWGARSSGSPSPSLQTLLLWLPNGQRATAASRGNSRVEGQTWSWRWGTTETRPQFPAFPHLPSPHSSLPQRRLSLPPPDRHPDLRHCSGWRPGAQISLSRGRGARGQGAAEFGTAIAQKHGQKHKLQVLPQTRLPGSWLFPPPAVLEAAEPRRRTRTLPDVCGNRVDPLGTRIMGISSVCVTVNVTWSCPSCPSEP